MMNIQRIGLYSALILALLLPAHATELKDGIYTGFSPGKNTVRAETVVLDAIADARKTLRVAAYSFTSKDVAEALVAAHRKGIDVQVVMDKSQKSGKYSSATFLSNQGIPVRINSRYAIMHNKFIVVDGRSLQTGSFNYTKAADEKNAENVIYLRGNADIAKTYSREWSRLWDEAEAYTH